MNQAVPAVEDRVWLVFQGLPADSLKAESDAVGTNLRRKPRKYSGVMYTRV